jgi:hypothetical protein
MSLNDRESQRLNSFRRAARQIREASIISRGHDIELRLVPGDAGFDVYIRLLEDEPFRSLALAIRLVYLKEEPAYFLHICNLVARGDDSGLRQRVADIRRQYQDALRASENAAYPGDGLEPTAFSAQEVFEHWLYGIAFHQDEGRRISVERLVATGWYFIWRVQAIALQLAGRILDLDDVVADCLGEPKLPRIVPTSEAHVLPNPSLDLTLR